MTVATQLFDLTDRAILITGASRGIGLAMARACGAHGATVVLNGRNAEALQSRVDELTAEGIRAEAEAFDVTDEAAGRAALERIVGRHGRLWGLIANAGVQHRVPVLDFPTEDFRRVVDTNLTACFTLGRDAARYMVEAGGGRIVNTVSMLGPQARPTVPAYIAAKEGLRALTRAMAVELGSKGITVNAVAPGYVATEMNTALIENTEFNAWVVGKTPLGRWADPAELGGAAVYLMADAGSFVSGQILGIDGGMSVQV
ncbi:MULTISPECIES: SDR family NAD(P)-dependent oxidoreductase [Thalassobaculum]|uniref:Gluconate 5-dehydrogenase n=1 Tax=Thalassobaculum litoreum DSM 18839 TaxID=1123362 RepID=A0A8G2EYB1_9PROT|nr:MULTISPECIES: SDR family oxidoreductase [Thalassobaculum]SDF75878.1 gluconate 5-dehydrogenase [Thalassobaculum litoreum DSM 18839]